MFDPRQQIDSLRDALMNGKMPIGFMIGAGCPMSVISETGTPIIPGIGELTKAVIQKLMDDEKTNPLIQNIILQFEKDKKVNPTIEDILSHLRSLRVVLGLDSVRGLNASDLDLLDSMICNYINDIVNKTLPLSNTPYRSLACWANDVSRLFPVEVFTTNYDLLFEQACDANHVPYFDGFVGGNKPFFDIKSVDEDVLPLRWVRVWKIHGSVNWYQKDGQGIYRSSEHVTGDVSRIIHPSHLKYRDSKRMPYLAMIDKLRMFLKGLTPVLVLCGYSFGDEHINEVIIQGLESNNKAVAYALMYDTMENNSRAVELGEKCSRLNVMARDGGVITKTKGSWIISELDSAPVSKDKSIQWEKVKDNHYAMRFMLGDFASFGRFLNDFNRV